MWPLPRPALRPGVLRVAGIVLICSICTRGRSAEVTESRIESARLYGNINEYAYYFTDILVGTEPQRVSVIVDTGSSLCGFPCEGCGHCGRHIDPPFAIDRSLSAQWIACSAQCEGSCQQGVCSYTQSYTEGSSISGLWFRDQIQLGDALQENPPVNATLGCHVDERKLFYTQRVNGIMGMAPHENDGRPTILQDLFVDRQHVNTGIFSMCLAEWGGKLSVGGYEPRYHRNDTQIQWIPLLHSGYYSVSPTSLSMGGISIASGVGSFGTSLVDSGTTFTYFPAQVFSRLTAVLVAACSAAPGCGARREGRDCWRLEGAASRPSRFPSLSMAFEGGAEVRWPPEAYLFQRSEPTLWCHAFADNGADSDTVLGVSWMLHKDVIFDLRRSQLGVVEAQCPEYRKAPGERSGEFEVSVGSRRPAAFTALLIGGTGVSFLVAVAVLVWLFYSSCGCCSKDGSYSQHFDREEHLNPDGAGSPDSSRQSP